MSRTQHPTHESRSITSMRYKNHIHMNPETMRSALCPVCQNEVFGEHANFYRMFGTPLNNRCSGEEELKNHGDARCCEYCGAEIDFFWRNILAPYTEEQHENDDELENQMVLATEIRTAVRNASGMDFADDDELPF